jgi:hypothetical protein
MIWCGRAFSTVFPRKRQTVESANKEATMTFAQNVCAGMKHLCVSCIALVLFCAAAHAEYVLDGDVVTDTETELVWMRADNGSTLIWRNALAYCEGLTYGGYDDWRLPNAKELFSLVDLTRSYPSLNAIFSITDDYYFWTGTPISLSPPGYSWCVDFGAGEIDTCSSTYDAYVRCVRAGPE